MPEPDGLYRTRTAAYYDGSSTGLPGDVEFYVSHALHAAGDVLEVGCGTGRVLIPLAEAGVRITGLDPAAEMLAIARAKLGRCSPETRALVDFVQSDIESYDTDRRFAAVIIPYRAFLHLLTAEHQLAALTNIHRLLLPDGKLVLNVFDPSLEALVARSGPLAGAVTRVMEFAHPENGRRVVLYSSVTYDRTEQLLLEQRTFEALDDDGRMVDRVHATLTLRYVFRYEMEHLLARCGFDGTVYGDFGGGPFVPGGEQVWVARKKEEVL